MILEGAGSKAMNPKTNRALRDAGRWLLACIERFPIPIEEALWVEELQAHRGRRKGRGLEEENQPMTEILREIVRHPSAWYGRDLANDSSWIVHLEPDHLAEIAAAVQSVTRRGLPFAALTRDDFPLPTLGPLLRQWQEEIIDGRGFYVLRGLNARGLHR